MKLSRIIDLACKIDGWMDTNEMQWLYEQARKLPDGANWVEVGCWKGRSFLPTAMGMREGQTIHAVDTFGGDAQCPNHWEAREVPGWIYGHFALTVSTIKRLNPSPPWVTIHMMSSVDAASVLRTKGLELDGVFIDASHYYPAVSEDIKVWMPLIKRGGILCGHDSTYPDVKRALDELAPGWKQGPKTIWWINR